jgi:transketolase
MARKTAKYRKRNSSSKKCIRHELKYDKSKSKLNIKIFDKDIEQLPIRKGFGDGLVIAGDMNKNVVGLCADLTDSTVMNLFKNKYPDRFVEIGIAEQNLASVASGMSAMGKIPFITSYAMFSPGRNWEQIRTTICYNDRPVKIAGSHAGISVGPDGGTHQAIEDMAITRVIPRMVVISPCDAIEARKATIACSQTKDPTYIRLAREKTPIITTEETPFEIGRANVLMKHEAPKVALFATGPLVHAALMAAQSLEQEGIPVSVTNVHTIKPLDTETVVREARLARAVVSIEEHQVTGGLGSAIAETLVRECPVAMEFIGVQDRFGQSGTPDELYAHYGMDASHIIQSAKKVIARA